MSNLGKALGGKLEKLPKGFTVEILSNFKHASITSVDVKRSLLAYNLILTRDRRRNSTE